DSYTMTATAHALVGGAIAASISNPALGIPLAAISHPLMDMIPHWDFGLGWRKKSKVILFLQSFGDLSLGVILTFILFGNSTNHLYLFLCILISESWDILQMPYLLFNWNFFPFSTFYKFGHCTNGKAKLPWGILTQVASVTGLVLVLRNFH
ncbi:MAG: hypothetical protein Q7R49_00300, partial [Candidatus Daviesbacteria bacterium]|nr:hypothetical protein [Candidatus Daviesbacteria bacterium]